jgi:acyl carrier protein
MRMREIAPMSNPNMKEELRALIAEIAEKDEIPDDVSFKDLGIDSMMGVEIVAAIERKYQVKIEDAELTQVTTLNASMALVEKKLHGRQLHAVA